MNPESMLVVATAVLAVATGILAWGSQGQCRYGAKEFRATRLPVVELMWRPGTTVGASSNGNGQLHRSDSRAFPSRDWYSTDDPSDH